MKHTNDTTKSRLLYWIIIFLGCTSFPVLNVAGSFKIYEALGFILLAYNFIVPSSQKNKIDRVNVFALFFFIIIPVSSYIYSIVNLEYPYGFFVRWASYHKQGITIGSPKLNYYIFPLFQLLLLAMNYTVFASLVNNNGIFKNFGKLMKAAIGMGTFIALYSTFASFVYDVIPYLPGIIQAQPVLLGRSRGFSQEPSVYALYQSWIIIFIFYSKHLYKKHTWYILFIINFFSLINSLSSTMIGLVFSMLLVFAATKGKLNKKMSTATKAFSFVLLLGLIVFALDLQDTVTTYFYDKVFIFLNSKSHDNTGTSGASRAFHNALGYRIFTEYPFLGVGQGHSQYYMYVYEFKMGIKKWGERIHPLSTPFGVMPLVMAEQGILGLAALLLFYFQMVKKMWVKRRLSNYHKMFLTGGLFTFVYFFTLFPVYHVFIWAPLGLGLGYIRYFDKQRAEVNAQANQDVLLAETTNFELSKT